MYVEAHNISRWYAIHTKPKQEERTENNLKARSIETFHPQLQKRHYSSRLPAYTLKSLFPGYIFARFDADVLLYKVRFTRGVHDVVSFGGKPIPVDDEIITMIQWRVREEDSRKIGDRFKKGDKVLIQAGPFKGLTGTLERSRNDRERVLILLSTLNYQARMAIEAEVLEKVN